MKSAPLLLFAALPLLAGADTVYKCVDGGRTAFTGTPTGPSCQPMGIQATEPDPQEAARQRRETELWNEQRQEQVQRILDREAKTERDRHKAELDAVSMVPRLSLLPPARPRRYGNRYAPR